VTREAEVDGLCNAALEGFGRIDVWVNNAGVTAFGRLDQGTFEAHRRVIETNLFGAMYGARAVLPVFRRQGRGVLINVGSVLSQIGQPFVPSYVISKFALRGLTEALRAEVANTLGIHVCSLLPYAVDTEHFESGANLVGLDAHPLPPTQAPEKVARALADLAAHPRREVHVPRVAALGLCAHALFPRSVERVIFDVLARWHFGDERLPYDLGNLYRPEREGGDTHGERQARVGSTTLALFALRRFVEIGLERIFGRAPVGASAATFGEDPVTAAREMRDSAA
jgi:short-subunit dehydrogenase